MVLVIFVVLLAIFVILPLVGWAVWFFISAAISGIILGGLARLIIPGRQPIGILATILIEIGVAAIAVLAWSAASRNSSIETGRRKIIDV